MNLNKEEKINRLVLFLAKTWTILSQIFAEFCLLSLLKEYGYLSASYRLIIFWALVIFLGRLIIPCIILGIKAAWNAKTVNGKTKIEFEL